MFFNEKILEKNNYLTHNNGDRPYRVIIKDNKTIILNEHTNSIILNIVALKIWIGEGLLTQMTKYSGGHGNNFKGNSILLYVNNYYIFIGHNIFSFQTNYEIINYVSDIGTNDIPYPYAVDKNNNYYLMLEEIMLPVPYEYSTDPYEYFYKNKNYNNIINVKNFIGEYNGVKQNVDVSYVSNPIKSYSHTWMKNLQAVNNNGEIFSVSELDYINMMKLIENKYNYKKININIIHPKLII